MLAGRAGLFCGHAVVALLAAFLTATTAAAVRGPLAGTTTSSATIGGDADRPYSRLRREPGWRRVVRDDLGAKPVKRRHVRRRSLLYFAQLSDFQLADEESPARVEALDLADTPFDSAWRPQEALEPFTVDEVVRQVNRLDRSPVRHRRRRHARLALTITTGDSADNQQINETRWVVRLLEGGRLDPNSGVAIGGCAALTPLGEAARYTGVQDDDDVLESGRFYDPDSPSRAFRSWPHYPGLMDRAQLPFQAAGLHRPSYVALGNHDGTFQGNFHALRVFDDIARGCVKPLTLSGALELTTLLTRPASTVLVPPDPDRGFADSPTYKAIHAAGRQRDDHGFAFVDGDELGASDGHAAYYSFSPRRGLRLIAINTLAEGDRIGSDGNLDTPQFAWLQRELKAAEGRGELVIVFGHHPIGSLTNPHPDEDAGDCALRAVSGPGCDRDPRVSRPVRHGPDLQRMLLAHPRVIAYVAGHTHEHRVTPVRRPRGPGGFWALETSSEIDWPIQSRLLEVMDNRDGTLSIFGTILDHGARLDTPPPGTPAAGFDTETLAAVGRELAFNDPQVGAAEGAIGRPQDRNVELLVADPRR